LKLIIKIFISISILLTGCSLNVDDIQSIDIDTYDDNNENIKLAEDLIYYDPRYIAYKVPSFNEKTAKGIKLGYFVRSSDGKPTYRITYSLKVPSVVKSLDSLKSEFESYIPELAKIHASKKDLFNKLSPAGEAWAISFFNSSAPEVLKASSAILQETINPEQLGGMQEKMLNEYGELKITSYFRAQYYEEFENIPESVSLYYSQEFSSSKLLVFRVSMHQQKGEWVVMGFNIQPQS
jgi:hypothetical protein